MSSLQPVRGTHDLLPEDMRRHRVVTDTAREVAALYGYQEMGPPVFEFTEVFKRTLGDTSDVVTNEMYIFAISEREEITLRPEATAGIARALISNGLTQSLPQKFYCAGPMFRHERPQKGRQRQFHQIDIELLGVAEPLGDVEIIAVGAHILERLGVLARTILELNTLGDPASRQARGRPGDLPGGGFDAPQLGSSLLSPVEADEVPLMQDGAGIVAVQSVTGLPDRLDLALAGGELPERRPDVVTSR